jgi:hypothetical protein
MEFFLIFLGFCLLVFVGAYFQGRRWMRELEKQFELRTAAAPMAVFQSAAGAAKGMLWTVMETAEGLSTRHSRGSVIEVTIEPQDDGGCVATVFLSRTSYISQLGGLIKSPRAYRGIRRRRSRILSAISTTTGSAAWVEVPGLN